MIQEQPHEAETGLGEEQVVMASLHDVLEGKIPLLRQEVRELVSSHGEAVFDKVTIAQMYGGMRGIKALICDTSRVDPDRGLLVRSIPISNLTDRSPEEIFLLLCTGDRPDEGLVADLSRELEERSHVPDHVWKILSDLPKDTHPMCMLTTALLSLQGDSVFSRQYAEGSLSKDDYWRPTLEDALTLLARIPVIAAGIYRLRFSKGQPIEPQPGLDWAANFAHMLGIDDPTGEFRNLMRLYMVLHCDHEGGNVSAHACNLVGSALSDLYYSVAAGLTGLAGPLHGLANQECLRFLLSIRDQFGGVPTDDDLEDFAWNHLKSGRVIPGYGHAVLRCADPRFTAFLEFGRRVCPDDEVFRLVDQVYRVIPDVLRGHGKAKNPFPNVDAGSGSLLHFFGLTEFSYYTVLFSVSRALGLCAQGILNRGLLAPIERPKSVSTARVQEGLAK